MGQFELLSAPILLAILMLSAGMTPTEAEPFWMQYLMRILFPALHFVDFSQAVLFRGADFPLSGLGSLQSRGSAAFTSHFQESRRGAGTIDFAQRKGCP